MEVFGKDKWGLGHYKDLAKGIEQRSSCTLAQMRVVLSRQKNFSAGLKGFTDFTACYPGFEVFCCQNGVEFFLVAVITPSTSG